MHALLCDLRQAVRVTRHHAGFTTAAATTLALGIGVTTAIGTMVQVVLFEPLPYPESNRIAMIWEIGSDGERGEGTFGLYRQFAERSRSFSQLVGIAIEDR